jgi:hypothetical protein
MSKDALLEYIEALRLRYKNATKSKKTVILNEFCETSGIERKQAIKLLNRKVGCSTRKPGPERIYSDEVAQHLHRLWLLTKRLCSKRLKAAIPIWLNYYEIETSS